MGKREVIRNGRVYLFDGNKYAGSRSATATDIPTSAETLTAPQANTDEETTSSALAGYASMHTIFLEQTAPATDESAYFTAVQAMTEEEVNDIVTDDVKQRETDVRYTVHSVVDTHMEILGNRHPMDNTFWAADEEEAIELMSAWWESVTRNEYYEIVSIEPYQKP